MPYGVFEVKSLDAWRDYLQLMYGLELAPSRDDAHYEAQIDDTGCRLIFRQGRADDCVAAGWECDDLEGLEAQIEQNGAPTRWGSSEDAARRGATRLLYTLDPNGLQIEIVDQTSGSRPFAPAGHGNVYDAGDLGMGHMTFRCSDLDAFSSFYTHALGLRLTDFNQPVVGPGLRVYVLFMRANARHHSVAAAHIPRSSKRLDHFQLEVARRDDVGLAYDRVRKSRHPIAHHIGVHPNDNQLSFYVVSPSGFQSELGCGSDLVQEDHEVVLMTDFSRWGHSMPFAQKMRALRGTWPLLLDQKLRRAKPPKCFEQFQ